MKTIKNMIEDWWYILIKDYLIYTKMTLKVFLKTSSKPFHLNYGKKPKTPLSQDLLIFDTYFCQKQGPSLLSSFCLLSVPGIIKTSISQLPVSYKQQLLGGSQGRLFSVNNSLGCRCCPVPFSWMKIGLVLGVVLQMWDSEVKYEASFLLKMAEKRKKEPVVRMLAPLKQSQPAWLWRYCRYKQTGIQPCHCVGASQGQVAEQNTWHIYLHQ